MRSVHFQVTVGQEGLVQFQLPDDFKNQEVELIVVIQPVVQKTPPVEKSVDWVISLQKARQLVKQSIPAERDLVAELLAERRRMANDE